MNIAKLFFAKSLLIWPLENIQHIFQYDHCKNVLFAKNLSLQMYTISFSMTTAKHSMAFAETFYLQRMFSMTIAKLLAYLLVWPLQNSFMFKNLLVDHCKTSSLSFRMTIAKPFYFAKTLLVLLLQNFHYIF